MDFSSISVINSNNYKIISLIIIFSKKFKLRRAYRDNNYYSSSRVINNSSGANIIIMAVWIRKIF